MLRKCSFLESMYCSMVIAVVLASAARADVPVQLVGQWGGAIQAVAVEGDRAYVGVGPRLVVLGVSQPSAPAFVGQSPVLPEFVQGVAVSGRYAYALSSGLHVIDVSDPAAPIRVGGCNLGGRSLAVSGNYAYLAAGNSLQVIDISKPTAPVRVGECDTSGHAWNVAVSGSYAYVSEGGAFDAQFSLQVIDISTPAAPVRMGRCYTVGYPMGVAVSGGYAYVVEGGRWPSLQVIDISTPAAPVAVGRCGTWGYPYDVAISGRYAYVAGSGDLQVIDVSDPIVPVHVGRCETAGHLESRVAVSGGYAYVAGDNASLQVIDVSNPAAPVRVSGYDTSGGAYDVAVSNDYAYLADFYSGLHVLDISNPAAPALASRCSTRNSAGDVAVSAGYAYVTWCPTSAPGGLDVIDISNPAAPVCLGGYEGSKSTSDVAVSGGYGYVSYHDWICDDWFCYPTSGGLWVFDISNPAAPVLIAGCGADPESAPFMAVTVSGGYAYVAGGQSLQVIDISNPAAPIRVGRCDTSGWANDVAVTSNYAYLGYGVGNSSGGLDVIDISDPAAPVRVGQCDTTANAQAVAVSGRYAFVISGTWDGFWWSDFSWYLDGDLDLIDISNPTAPVRVGGYRTSGDARNLAVSSGYVYVSDGEGGLVILALDQDQDGIVDPQDSCPNSDLSATVVIQTCNTGVANKMLDSGCTMADGVAAVAAQAGNHGAFVSGVAELTNAWKKAGLITGAQKDAIQSCAAAASIP